MKFSRSGPFSGASESAPPRVPKAAAVDQVQLAYSAAIRSFAAALRWRQWPEGKRRCSAAILICLSFVNRGKQSTASQEAKWIASRERSATFR